MGQHKRNPVAIAAKRGELPPKPSKMSKTEKDMLILAKCQEEMHRVICKDFHDELNRVKELFRFI